MALATQKIKLPGIHTIIGILSGKGGTGKTFVASSLAATLAKLGKKVGILDADIACPNIFKILGIKEKLIPTPDNKMIPLEKYGIKIISMAGLCESEDEPIVWRGPIISKIIQQFLKESMWGELDFLVIDFPTGAADTAITLLNNFTIDGVIIVTTPQELAINDARKTINMAGMLRVPVVGIVENMRGDIFGDSGGAHIANSFNLPLLGSIPMRKQIVSLTDSGIPPVFQMEELEMIFGKIARSIVDRVLIK